MSLLLKNYRLQRLCILGELVYNVILAYSAHVSRLVALSSMCFAVTWIFDEWIQPHFLHKHHEQAMNKFQGNLLHGLQAYANLVEWSPLASSCDCKPVSHVCYCLNHNNKKSDFSKLSIKMMVRLFTAAKLAKSIDLSRLYPRILCICLEERYIPIFVSRYGCRNDLNKMTNFHCSHRLGEGDQAVLSSWFSIELW